MKKWITLALRGKSAGGLAEWRKIGEGIPRSRRSGAGLDAQAPPASLRAQDRLDRAVGIGIIAGNRPEAAKALAIIDAAYNAELPETAGWTAVLEAEEQRLYRERRLTQARIMDTRVDFEVMDNG